METTYLDTTKDIYKKAALTNLILIYAVPPSPGIKLNKSLSNPEGQV